MECVLDSSKLCTDEYQKKLMNSLINGRQHWSKKFISSNVKKQNDVHVQDLQVFEHKSLQETLLGIIHF